MARPSIVVKTKPRPYPVHTGRGLIARLPELLRGAGLKERAVIVTDRRLRAGIAGQVVRALKRAGWRTDIYALPSGEAAKSFGELQKLYTFLLSRKIERRIPLLAVGGGTVGDAAGFAAATYYRGIPLVHIPTTLLAQVDSAIGGKTAVNHPHAKNAVGAFYQPVLVAADTDALRTLPRAELLAGLAEVVKYALVFDRAFARWLETNWKAILRGEHAPRARMIRRCAELKAAVVAADERDLSGKRELLNFGHTIGHALEAATGYRLLRHGEAVAWGMRAAIALAKNRGWLADAALADSLLAKLPAPRWSVGTARILDLLRGDKKVAGGKNVFILLKRIGAPRRKNDVTSAEIRRALKEIA
ncbi:MAG: 3-dehydroquinate synthase [Elusimicrobiota bacterium]